MWAGPAPNKWVKPSPAGIGLNISPERVGPIPARKEVGLIPTQKKFLFKLGQTESGPKKTKLGRKPGPAKENPTGEGNYFPFPHLLHA